MQNKKNPKFSFVFLSLIRTSDLKVEGTPAREISNIFGFSLA